MNAVIQETQQKQCCRCRILKSVDEFHKKGSRIHSACKSCVSEEKRLIYKNKNRQKRAKGVRQIQLDRLKVVTSVYAGDEPCPTFEDHLKLLQSFILEDVLCGDES